MNVTVRDLLDALTDALQHGATDDTPVVSFPLVDAFAIPFQNVRLVRCGRLLCFALTQEKHSEAWDVTNEGKDQLDE